MKKTINSILSVVLVVIIIFLLGFMIVESIKPNEPDVNWISYRVKDGDTLWKLASISDEYDTRVIVDMIKEHNNISSNIYAGTIIEVPVIK